MARPAVPSVLSFHHHLPSSFFVVLLFFFFIPGPTPEDSVRFSGKSRLCFYPLPITEAQRIRRFLSFPDVASTALDPCVGDGVAFEAITSGGAVLRYGIELDAYRAEQAKERIPSTVQGNALEVHCPVDNKRRISSVE
jgi:hypothetical protein